MTTLANGQAPEIEVGLTGGEARPRARAPFGRRLAPVRGNAAVGAYRLISVEDEGGPSPEPGQFYMLAAAERWGGGEGERPFLARAFSVCRTRGKGLDFLLEDIGPGTRRLATLAPGEDVWLVGPLGAGFRAPWVVDPSARRALLVGGGIGVAPLVIWSETLAASNVESRVLLGFRSASYSVAADLFADQAEIATDDGSTGRAGLVTELLATELDRTSDAVVYACGPPAMLEAVRRICAASAVAAELALEEAMACGFGACFGCVVRTRTGYRRICVDGPVMSADELDGSWLER
jgi:dihydroorotate dehydrogenase electron transfer subunit